MPRQSITFTEPNDHWLSSQITSQEYSSKSELVNDLIRKARREQEELGFIRAKLREGEKSGMITQTKKEILREFKKDLGISY